MAQSNSNGMSLTVRNATGESVQLSNSPFAQGGEAAVHAVPKFPGVVVKLYHPLVRRCVRVVLENRSRFKRPETASFKNDLAPISCSS